MEWISTTLSIPCGAGTAAVGLYALMRAGNRAALRWIGWSLYAGGGVLVAGTVLESTGSFWSLLLFCLLSGAALICLTAGTVQQPRVGVATDLPDSQARRIRLSMDLMWFLGAVAAVVSILVWHGNYWSSGALLVSAAFLGLTMSRPAFNDSAPETKETNDAQHSFREPALACAMWGLLIWGLISALQHWQSSSVVGTSGIQAGRLNNTVALACGVLSLGVLQIATREELRSRLFGAGSLLLGTLLICSAGADHAQSEVLSLVILVCAVINIGFIISATRIRPSTAGADPLSIRGDE